MAVLQWIGLVYLGGALLMALYQAWRMVFRLDAFDWHYERMEVWVNAILSTLLWPLVIFAKARGTHVPLSFSMAARMRELDRLERNPPPCGEVVEYTTYPMDSSTPRTVFRFPAEQLLQAMLPTMQENPHLMNGDRGSIFRWLSSHDPKVVSPTPVPDGWDFTQVAAAGLEAGSGEAECSRCRQRFAVTELICHRTQPSRAGGWVLDFWRCPAGHDLLRVEVMHFSVATPRDDSDR
jgi:hypothetical protein